MVPNGVDITAADAAVPGYGTRIGIPADAFVVLFLGRLHRIKRLDILADAFAIARTTHRSLHLVLAGPDEETLMPGIRTRLAAHALQVHAPGAVTGADKWSLLKDAHVTVQCSDSESFGVSVVESLAAGVPVIATRTCPWPELETHDCGRWVEQTPAAIADAIRDLADDAAMRQAMGRRGAAFARDRYSWDSIARTMTGIYSGVH
jgi:glycosyltransferase involved in cell wall biosynthesis